MNLAKLLAAILLGTFIGWSFAYVNRDHFKNLHRHQRGYGQKWAYHDTLTLQRVLLAVRRHDDAIIQEQTRGTQKRYVILGYTNRVAPP